MESPQSTDGSASASTILTDHQEVVTLLRLKTQALPVASRSDSTRHDDKKPAEEHERRSPSRLRLQYQTILRHSGAWEPAKYNACRKLPRTGLWTCCGCSERFSIYCPSLQRRFKLRKRSRVEQQKQQQLLANRDDLNSRREQWHEARRKAWKEKALRLPDPTTTTLQPEDERHFFRRQLKVLAEQPTATTGDSVNGSTQRGSRSQDTDYHRTPTVRELPMIFSVLKKNSKDLSMVKTGLALLGQALQYRVSPKAFRTLAKTELGDVDEEHLPSVATSSSPEGKAFAGACKEAVANGALPLSLQLIRHYRLERDVVVEVLLLWRQLSLCRLSRLEVMNNEKVFQSTIDTLKTYRYDAAVEHLATHVLSINTSAEMECDAIRSTADAADSVCSSDRESVDDERSGIYTTGSMASSANASTAFDGGICVMCIRMVAERAKGFMLPAGKDLLDGILAISRQASRQGSRNLSRERRRIRGGERLSAESPSGLVVYASMDDDFCKASSRILGSASTTDTSLTGTAANTFGDLRDDARTEASRKVLVINCFRILSDTATAVENGRRDMIENGCVDICLRVMIGCRLEPKVTKAAFETLACACEEADAQQDIARNPGAIRSIVRAIQALPAELGVQLRGLQLIQTLVQEERARFELDKMRGAWQYLCQGIEKGDDLIRYQLGAYYQMGRSFGEEERLRLERVSGRPRKAFAPRRGAKVERYLTQGMQDLHWSAKRLQNFMGLQLKNQKAAINVAAKQAFFEAIRDSRLLPMANESRHHWLDRVSRYEKSNNMSFEEAATEAAKQLEQRIYFEKLQAKEFDSVSHSTSGSTPSFLRRRGRFVFYQ